MDNTIYFDIESGVITNDFHPFDDTEIIITSSKFHNTDNKEIFLEKESYSNLTFIGLCHILNR